MSEQVTQAWSNRPGATPVWPDIPGFEIAAELGRGGMGIVYKAFQAGQQRWVALKVLRDGALAGPRERARFQLEAEVCSRIQHPNIVPIHEVAEHQGQLWFAMELLEGSDLARLLGGLPQPPRRSALLVRTLARAVGQAHELNIIHRDLKPANVLFPTPVLNDETCTQVKITDFGLAKRLDSASTAWTQDGAILGTPSYMAPEQAAGQVHDVGLTVDVYALGAILYELLTGRPPFQGDSWQRTVDQVIHEEPLPPTQVAAGIPPELETICLKCLEKEPTHRYPDAAALAADLDRFLAGATIVAVPIDTEVRLTRLAGRAGYVIETKIGRSADSTVYRARFGELQQLVALKVFAPGVGSRADWETRLRDAAPLLGNLTHPHLVLPQQTTWWDGAGVFCLEYVPQGSLADRLTGRPVPLLEALRLVEQVCEVICYLHRQGVIHGNLKPANVLLAADGIPRLSDPQLTKQLGVGTQPRLSSDPVNLVYVAPEHRGGRPPVELRPHTDTYGLGLLLYELLTGEQPPATGEFPSLASRNRDISAQLEAFCRRCLHPNPWERYPRAYNVLRRLRYFIETLDSSHAPGRR